VAQPVESHPAVPPSTADRPLIKVNDPAVKPAAAAEDPSASGNMAIDTRPASVPTVEPQREAADPPQAAPPVSRVAAGQSSGPTDAPPPAAPIEPERTPSLPSADADAIRASMPMPPDHPVELASYTAPAPVREEIPMPVAAPAVALKSYCPVELIRNGRWARGNPQWTVVYQGSIYRFSGAAQRQAFLANPEAFVPVNGGNDVVLLVDENRTVAGQMTYCATYQDRLYMFSSSATQARFNEAPHRYAVQK
jgi:YHS domain-containing protein